MILTTFFSIYFHVKRRPLPFWPNSTHGNEDCKKKLESTWGCFHTSFSFSGQKTFENNIFFLHFLYTYSFVKLTLHCGLTYPWESLIKTWIYTMWGCFHNSFSFSCQIVFEKMAFEKIKQFSKIHFPLKESVALILVNLNLLQPFAKFGWKLAQQFLRRNRKCNSLQKDGQTDARKILIRKAYLSIQ